MSEKKLKIIFRGVWNSSDIGLDLGKLHNQIQTLESSWLDFTATGAANDFSHTFSNFISGKDILSNVFSYVAVGALILLLIIILPCIIRILWKSIQKLSTELYLIIINKKGGDVGSQREKLRPWQRSWGRKLGICKGVIKPQETPCSRASAPKTRLLYRELSPITISLREGVNLQLQLIKIPGCDKSVSTYKLLWRLSSPPV